MQGIRSFFAYYVPDRKNAEIWDIYNRVWRMARCCFLRMDRIDKERQYKI